MDYGPCVHQYVNESFGGRCYSVCNDRTGVVSEPNDSDLEGPGSASEIEDIFHVGTLVIALGGALV